MKKKGGSGLIVLSFLSWTNSRAAARAERRRKPQTTRLRFHPTCIAQGTAAPYATTHCIQRLVAQRLPSGSTGPPSLRLGAGPGRLGWMLSILRQENWLGNQGDP